MSGTVLEMIYGVWDSSRYDIYLVCGTVVEMIYGVWDSSRDDIQCVGHF